MGSDTRKAVARSLAKMRDYAQNQIKRTTLFTDRTTHLRNSIIGNRVNAAELYVTVEAKAEYGKFVNDGTRNKDGSTRIKARKFMETGLAEASPQFERILKDELDKVI